MEHIQLNLAFSHLLRGQSAASKWLHFFAFQPPTPPIQMPVWRLVCFSKKHWLSHWNTFSWKRSEGSTLFSNSPGFSPIFLDFSLYYLSSSGFKNSHSLGLSLHQFLFRSVIKLLINQMITSLLSVYHVPGTMLGTSEHQWMGQKSLSSWNSKIYYGEIRMKNINKIYIKRWLLWSEKNTHNPWSAQRKQMPFGIFNVKGNIVTLMIQKI